MSAIAPAPPAPPADAAVAPAAVARGMPVAPAARPASAPAPAATRPDAPIAPPESVSIAPRTLTCPICGGVTRPGIECERCAAWTMMAYALGRPRSIPPTRPASPAPRASFTWIVPMLGLPAAGGLYFAGNLIAAAAVAWVSILALGWYLFRRRGPRASR